MSDSKFPLRQLGTLVLAVQPLLAATLPEPGALCPEVGPLVGGVRFSDSTRLAWDVVPEAVGYNIYLHRSSFAPPPFVGECLYSSVPESSTLLHGKPLSGEVWMFQVTALLPNGEGPMGFTSDCTPLASHPCTCTLPADPGPCDAVIPRWYHNFQSGQCELFIWGGCGGNANNFETQEACDAACRDLCALPAVVGPCDAVIPRWYFSVLSIHCEEFIWGGCGGNANNFPDEDSCRSSCGDLCWLPPVTGDCDGKCPRWFHDPGTGQCQTFMWGCCSSGSNANNFATQAECEAECVDICTLPQDPGPCDGACPRWFYDAETGHCEEFVYGCCGGNANNFVSQEACEAACLP